MKVRTYPSPAAFKQALEQSLRASAKTGAEFARKVALLATIKRLEATRLRAALKQTFAFRGTHVLRDSLPDPLPAWEMPYAAIAREDRLAWATLGDVTAAARTFLDPILAGTLAATWDPRRWSWRS